MDLQRAKISHVRVYESKEFVYVVGKCLLTAAGREFAASLEGRDEPPARDAERYRLLRFEKARSMLPEARKFKDFVYEDPGLYTAAELESVLKRLAEGKGRRSGALNRVVDAVAIVGVVRFVKGFYLVLISNRAEIGQLDEHVIYAAQGSHLVPLFDEAAVDASAGTPARKSAWSIFSGTQDPLSAMEDEFKSLFKLVDLSKSFYWSYTYNLSMSVQRNVAARIASRARERDPSMVPPGAAKAIAEDNMFIWNEYLARPLLDALQTSSRSVFLSPWTITLVHGSFKQQRCSILSRSLTLTLVARRSRFYAGTRYLKRGVNDDGYAANDVEIEQIVQDHMLLSTDPGGISAYVQMRGSIPTYWSQETSVAMPKPPIKRHRSDTWYTPTRMHFMDLISRYGDVILVLNLVKQTEKRKRETIVGSDFKHAIEVLNSMLPSSKAIEYCAVDFTRLSKLDPSSLLRALDTVAKQAIRETSFFMTPTKSLRFTEVNGNAPLWMARASRALRLELRKPDNSPFAETGRRGLGFHGEAQRLPLRWSTRYSRFVPMRINTALKLRTGEHAQLARQLSRSSRGSRRQVLLRGTTEIDEDVGNDASSVVATRDDMDERNEKSNDDDDDGDDGDDDDDHDGDDDEDDRNDKNVNEAADASNTADAETLNHKTAKQAKQDSNGDDQEEEEEEEEEFALGFGRRRRQSHVQSAGNHVNVETHHDADTQVECIPPSPLGSSDSQPAAAGPEGSRMPDKFGSEGVVDDDDDDDDDDEGNELGFTDLVDAQPVSSFASPTQPPRPGVTPNKRAAPDRIQHGVIRTNCIDCLDRTNLAQFLIGLHVINEQLIALGILSVGERVTTDAPIAAVLMEMYEELGDRIALQYGGSDAHRKSAKLVSSGSTSTRQQAFYTSLKRYYSNAFTDHAKQDSMNVFLGLYRPEHHKRQRENADGTGDFYLHNRGVTYPPNYTLQPRVLDLGPWWNKPLMSFAERVVVPLRTLAEHPYELLAPNAKEEDQGAHGQEDGFVSFDALFAKPYFRPRELVNPLELPGVGPDQFGQQQHGHAQTQAGRGRYLEDDQEMPSAAAVDFANAQASTRLGDTSEGRLRRAPFSNDTLPSSASSATRSSVPPDMRSRLFGPRSATNVLRGADYAIDDVDEQDRDDVSRESSLSLAPASMSAAEAFLYPSPNIHVGELDAVSQAYCQQAQDPFSLYEHPSAACVWRSELSRSSALEMQPWISAANDQYADSWNRRAHEREFRDALKEQQIHENDGWGMRRLQAYSGSTSIIMSGDFKGYPRSVTATVLELA